MKIGSALRHVRKELGLTQSQMCAGIVTRSFYAKIEANQHEITANKLAQILFTHEIDITWFYQLIKKDYISESQKRVEDLEKAMDSAVSENNLSKLEDSCEKIMKLSEHNTLKLRAIITLAYFRKELDSITNEVKKHIYAEFDEGKNWITRPNSIRLLANTMPLWPQENLDFLIGRLLAYLKKEPKISELTLERYLRLLGNYLATCYDKNKQGLLSKTNHINETVEYIINLPPNFHLMIYKIDAKFSYALINNQTATLEKIRNDLTYYGYGDVTTSWQ